ncbi:hypothetical protein GBA52_011670 [Prunus armeniaca]|nr:hypothetical protein GBA52_011451 [Prunus armeniaca]KAH0984493.1 hypothetical protein GBA52_011670 [Prunus armeniaca]
MAKTLSQIAAQIASPSISPLTSHEIFPIYNNPFPIFSEIASRQFFRILMHFSLFQLCSIH